MSPGDHIYCPLPGVPLQSRPPWGAPSPSAPGFGTSHPSVQDRETGRDVRILLAEQMTPLWDPSHSYPFCRARVFWMPLHLAPNFLPRLKLCTWNDAFGAGLSGQAAHPIPPHCQQLGLRFHEVSLHLPAAAICPGVPTPCPHPCGAGTEPGPCPASWALLNTSCSQSMGSWGQEKGERSGQIRACPCSTRRWESRQSLLAVHQESSRLSQHMGLVSCCSGLFPEKGKGGKRNKREMSESGLHSGSGPAAAAPLPRAPASKKMEQRGNQLLSTPGTPSPLAGDSVTSVYPQP